MHDIEVCEEHGHVYVGGRLAHIASPEVREKFKEAIGQHGVEKLPSAPVTLRLAASQKRTLG